MKQLKALLLATATLLIVAQAHALTDAQADKIRDRIQPLDRVCLTDDCSGAQPVAAGSAARSGEEVYTAACSACHSIGLLNAPKTGDIAAWDEKLSKGKDATMANAINGINAMPPKGNCMNCSDDEIWAAIEFMSGR